MNSSGVYQLFVYGSLRSGFKSPVYEYISRFFSFAGEGKVKGKLFDLGNYPAGVSTTDDKFIIGELYQVKDQSEFSWAIGQLDDYEGVSVEPDEIQLFKRELVEVYVNKSTTRAWIYWFNGQVDGKPEIESGDLIQYIQQKK
jgi:gamma-glutamylcyclotransferase (GGCT)/AIG2-like uncharacterized protein YtfP